MIKSNSKLTVKCFIMALSSFLQAEGLDFRFFPWERAEYFYVRVSNVYKELKLSECEYKSYQENYALKLKT